jgi:hypothetical protein
MSFFYFEAAELFVDRAASRGQFPDLLMPIRIIGMLRLSLSLHSHDAQYTPSLNSFVTSSLDKFLSSPHTPHRILPLAPSLHSIFPPPFKKTHDSDEAKRDNHADHPCPPTQLQGSLSLKVPLLRPELTSHTFPSLWHVKMSQRWLLSWLSFNDTALDRSIHSIV